MKTMKLKNKVAVVTGSGRGIGRAIAIAFAREGASVAVISRTTSEIEETSLQICASGGSVLGLQVDVSKSTDVEMMVKSTVEHFGRIDILVNNAGILGPVGPLYSDDVSSWVETIKVNLIGTFLCCKAVLPLMMQQHSGKIINLSGGGATSPRPMFSAYAASKCAIVGLTSTLAEEVKEFNIQINAVAPGAIFTRLHEQVLNAGAKAGNKELAASNSAKCENEGSLELATDLVVFLASDESVGLSGRLISAVWDHWKTMTKERIGKIMSSELYTMRRIDEVMFAKKR